MTQTNTSNFHSTCTSSNQYKGHYLKKGSLSTYVDGVKVYTHKGYGVYSQGAVFKGFRFTQVAAKALINHLVTV